MTNISLKLKRSDQDVEDAIEIEFANYEIEAFEDYLTFFEDLTRTSILVSGGQSKLSTNFDSNRLTEINIEIPSEDKVSALLHRMRPFVLKDEDTYFYKVRNYLARRIENSSFRNKLEHIKSIYQGGLIQKQILLFANEVQINHEDMLNKYLNAHEYHRDKDKRNELKTLHKLMPLESSRAIFIMMLFEQVKAISALAEIINVIQGEKGTTTEIK